MPHISTDVRRQQIIDAAVTVIATLGVDGATTRRIAEQAGAPLATLHYCFQTKENLLWAVFEQLADINELQIEASGLRGKSSQVIAEQLVTQTMQWLVDSPTINRAQIEILLWAERNDRALAAKIYEAVTDAWKEALRQARTPLPEAELDTLTRVLVAVVDGLCLQLITHGDGEKAMSDTATALSMLTAYLGRRSRKAA